MNKHLLFIPFMALLATSCGGGHITTTPVVKNAPSVALTRRNAVNPPRGQNVASINLGTRNWYKIEASSNWPVRFITPFNGFNAPTDALVSGNFFADGYTTAPWNLINNFSYDKLCCSAISGGTNYIGILDRSCDNMTATEFQTYINGTYFYFQPNANYTGDTIFEQGYSNGYNVGYQEGEAHNNHIIQNGQYAGLTAFPRRNYLQTLARRVVSGLEQLQDGHFDLIDTNANYTIYIKWSYSYPKTTFKDYGNTIIGELVWTDIISGNWSTSWFGKYDQELHYIASSPKYYATNEPIAMSFYPEVYLGSTIVGDVDLYFMGTANDYRLGFADGQTYTIQASETYNNVFTIFTPAFRAVANFFNLNIGPFKIWYFFAIPLIVSLLILVLRLVKH